MNTPSGQNPDSHESCPSCGNALAAGAVLCVACGYHLESDRFLATVAEPNPTATTDSNPYASPVVTERSPNEPPVFDLTEAGVRRVKAVVSDAQMVFLVILLAWCLCAPIWLVMLPWYLYRLYCWYALNAQFAELRSPNSFSPHGELAAKFKGSRGRLLVGIVAGLLFWLIAGGVFALRLFEAAL